MSNEIIMLIVGIVLGTIAGVLIAQLFSKSSSSGNLKKELKETKESLERQEEHFAQSEELLHNLTEDLKKLYQHMGKNEKSTLVQKFKGLIIEGEETAEKIEHRIDEVAEKINDSIPPEIKEDINEAKTLRKESNDVGNSNN